MKEGREGHGKAGTGVSPRIDATMEQITDVMLTTPPPLAQTEKSYQCVECEREVTWPDTLFEDQRCEQCHDLLGSS